MLIIQHGETRLRNEVPDLFKEVKTLQLTQREFLFLDDLLSVEQLGISQFQDFSQHCTDPQLKDLCQQIATQNLQHFNRLVRILNQGQGGQNTYHTESNQVSQPQWSGQTGGGFPQ